MLLETSHMWGPSCWDLTPNNPEVGIWFVLGPFGTWPRLRGYELGRLVGICHVQLSLTWSRFTICFQHLLAMNSGLQVEVLNLLSKIRSPKFRSPNAGFHIGMCKHGSGLQLFKRSFAKRAVQTELSELTPLNLTLKAELSNRRLSIPAFQVLLLQMALSKLRHPAVLPRSSNRHCSWAHAWTHQQN